MRVMCAGYGKALCYDPWFKEYHTEILLNILPHAKMSCVPIQLVAPREQTCFV